MSGQAPIRKAVGDIEVIAYRDGWPIQITITKGDAEFRIFGVEELTDLQYALDRVQVHLKPLVDKVGP